MPNPALVFETALLILAAFLIGATIGAVAKTLFLRMSRHTPETAVEVPVRNAEAPPAEALVAAPVLAPFNKPASPIAPLDVPTPDFVSIVDSIANGPRLAGIPALEPLPEVPLREPVSNTVMAPARVAGQATSGRQVNMLRDPASSDASARPTQEAATIIPFPQDRSSAPAASARVDSVDAPRTAAAEDITEPAEPTVPDAGSSQESSAAPLTIAGTDTAEVAASQPGEIALPAAQLDDDQAEAAAMRAIEGTGMPSGRAKRKKARPAPIPEIADIDLVVDASRPEMPPKDGRPDGLPGPRNGIKDNLTNIIGVLPVIETSLNGAGIYHFDQVAAFTDENIAWLEQHLGIAGRVTREHWREQARELAAVDSETKRRTSGQP